MFKIATKGLSLANVSAFTTSDNILAYIGSVVNLEDADSSTAFDYTTVGDDALKTAIRITNNRIYGYFQIGFGGDQPFKDSHGCL